MLDEGTTYGIRVQLTDSDGVEGSEVLEGQITTRSDIVPDAQTLQPTHYVRSDGDDTRAGTSDKTAWRTLEHAFAAAPGEAVVQVGPGFYQRPPMPRTKPITLVAQFPAVGDERLPVNEGQRSIIESGIGTSPSGTNDRNAGVWQAVTLIGPATGRTYTVWKWSSGAPSRGATEMAFAQTRTGALQRVAYWDRKAGSIGGYSLETPAGWAEVLHTNRSYRYGFTTFGADVYVRLANDLNPNDVYVLLASVPIGSTDGEVVLDGQAIRLSGFEIRQAGVALGPGAQRVLLDHNLFIGRGVYITGKSPGTYGSDHVIQDNRFEDSGLWSDAPRQETIPWNWVKGALVLADGKPAWLRVGAQAEITAIWSRGGASRLVVRRNTIDGYFNGIGGYNKDYDRYAQQDQDIYENLFQHIADDAFEPEQQGINWRIWRNRVEHSYVMLSTGPLSYGPLYFFRNEAWRIGPQEYAAVPVAPDGGVTGVTAQDTATQGAMTGTFFKFSGSSRPTARLYIVNNTLWTDVASVDGSGQYAGGGQAQEAFILRNNIIHATRYAFQPPSVDGGRWIEDHNQFSTTDRTRGLAYGKRYTDDVAGYRAATGQGAGTNVAGDFVTPPILSDTADGDLTLFEDSLLIDAGTVVPNISDRPGLDYWGRAPDLGARERS
jgi:hypothetical protein